MRLYHPDHRFEEDLDLIARWEALPVAGRYRHHRTLHDRIAVRVARRGLIVLGGHVYVPTDDGSFARVARPPTGPTQDRHYRSGPGRVALAVVRNPRMRSLHRGARGGR